MRARNTAVVLAFIFLLPGGPADAGKLEVYPGTGTPPQLVLEDLDGHTHALADYRGQVVLVNFWASWCPPCLMEMPGMERLSHAISGKPFTILAVNVRESPATIWRFRKLLKVNFPMLLDRYGQTAEDWGVSIYPTSYLVDTTGRIRYLAHGPLQWDDPAILQTITGLLAAPEPVLNKTGLQPAVQQ
jgi:thiol-disulfide isomerase/thioredoxin